MFLSRFSPSLRYRVDKQTSGWVLRGTSRRCTKADRASVAIVKEEADEEK
jgi:hypothetical protein